MKLSEQNNKYLTQWKYVEAAVWNEKEKKVSRKVTQKAPKVYEPIFYDIPAFFKLLETTGRVGIYSSIWRFNKPSLEGSTRLGSMYFDLDSDDLEVVKVEAIKVVDYLHQLVPLEAIRIYFTGKKGFHIEVEAVSLGITPSNDLPEIYRAIAMEVKDELELTTLDSAVYESRRMWRVPNTIHQSTGLYKREIEYEQLVGPTDTILELAKTPNLNPVPDPVFCITGNEWYRNHIYKIEEAKQARKMTPAMFLEQFNRTGVASVKYNQDDREFDPARLFSHCPSIMKLWEKAEKTHNLEHEERLFLCSILSYTPESIEYLHSILSHCDDYSWEKSNAHIQDWIRRREIGVGGRAYSCQRANSVGVGCGDCVDRMEPRKKMVRVGDKMIETDEYALPSPVRFGYSRKIER